MPVDHAAEDNARALDIVSNVLDLDGIIRPGARPTAIDFYVYSVPSVVVAPATTVNTQIITQSDSDFVVMYMSGLNVIAGVTTPIANNLFIQISDLSDGKTFFNTPTFAASVFGNRGFPYVLPCPKVWRPNTNISIGLTQNNAAVAALSVNLAFSGVRVYYG